MAEQLPSEGSCSKSTVPGESSDTHLELNVKTLDSRIFRFQVEKNMQVSALKEKIANDIGVSVGQQRLIFRGKVLKDDLLLSHYHVENGDTLHLVERQPTQPQASSGIGSGETTSNIGGPGNDANAGFPRGRIGQISHSVVLGTFNVGDQGEGVGPDISRVIGTVLNSIGLGNLAQANVGGNGQFPISLNIPGQGPQGNGTEGLQGNVSGQSQAGNQPSGQGVPNPSFQSLPQVVQIPLAATVIPLPSLFSPIPDSLVTLLEFMNRMEQAFSRNANQQNLSSTSSVELPPTARGLPTPEALGIVLRRAARLLTDQAVTALSHVAGRLEQEGSSSDTNIRSQIQSESTQTGLAMQHLGALFLELGRTILTLRMGQSPDESFVNAGPAVYISQSGPNPIMVQPFPLQTSSLFGGSVPPLNPVGFGPVGVGNPPRHVNIHIHAGTSVAPVASAASGRGGTGDGAQGEHQDANTSQDSGTARPLGNVISATGPPLASSTQPTPVSGTGTLSSGFAAFNSELRRLAGSMQEMLQVPSGQAVASVGTPVGSASASDRPISSVVADISSALRHLAGNRQEINQASSGQAAATVSDPSVGSASAHEQPNSSTETMVDSTQQVQSEISRAVNLEGSRDHVTSRDGSTPSGDATPSPKSEVGVGPSGSQAACEGTGSTPLGLGIGGLERKKQKRAKQPNPPAKGGDSGSTGSVPDRANAQTTRNELLQSLLSRGSTAERTNASTLGTGSPSPATRQATSGNTSSGGQASGSQFDVAGMMSQVLQSPALNGLLSGVSEQAGPPDVLRNMLQQLTQSPAMMNTVSRIAQQVDTQDLENMFSGMGRGQGGGGGIDLSRMVQQMMPIVSQALGGGPPGAESFPSAADHEFERQSSDGWHDAEDRGTDRIDRVELDGVARLIESLNPPGDVFRAMMESAVQSSGTGSGSQDLLDALCSDPELANEYAEVLGRDLSRRLESDYGSQL